MAGPNLKQLAERFSKFDSKKLSDTWGAIHRKREQLGNTRFPNSDPRWKAIDRLKKASSAVLSVQKTKLKEMEASVKNVSAAESTHELAKKYEQVTREKHKGDMMTASKDPEFQRVSKELKKRGVTTLNHIEAAKKDSAYRGGKEKDASAAEETGPRGGRYYINSNGQKTYVK